MTGIYIHIPFCKRKCTYCDFYTEVSLQFIPQIVDSIVKEIEFRQEYLQKQPIKTIYFGGGTPSVLNKAQFSTIFEAIYKHFQVEEHAEITFEANPDDLSKEYLESLHELPFNRISMGIQSFDDTDLKRINRRHTAEEARLAVLNAQNAGFNNISIDLIYGLPLQTMNAWKKQLEMALSLNVQHISAYGLTYEEGTALWKQREKGRVAPIEDEIMNEMYLHLVETVTQNGFEAYEVSNFAKPGYRSRHNTSYWRQEAYMGLGPSAHSYDLHSRQWNVSSIKDYINALENGTGYFEKEELNQTERFNDYVMVSLRTLEGIDLSYMEQEFGKEFVDYCFATLKSFIENKKVTHQDNRLALTPEGVMISNVILIELMKV